MSHAPIRYRRLRAPRGQGETLIEPPLSSAADLVAVNRSELSSVQVEIGGRSFASLRHMARAHLLREARRYTAGYRTVSNTVLDPEAPIVLAGHQPELFHPGVWFKNFALSRIGKHLAAPAVNLIIDNDTLAAPTIRVPTGSLSEPRVEAVAFDQPSEVVPFEERAIDDLALFASFPQRVKQVGGELLAPDLILTDMWPTAVQRAGEGAPLGEAIANARHGYEQSWGLETWELPLSEVCRGEAFRRFLLHIVQRLPEFQRIYNEALAEYRAVHKLRSKSHPAPDLATEDDYLEAPFWIWSREQPLRGRLYVRAGANQWELTDRRTAEHHLRLPLDADHSAALEVLDACERDGLKLRPRALITTMFVRLFLGDLFLHGIGGAKYDQLTDAIIRRFFGVEPPTYMTVTATAYLPLPMPEIEAADLTRLAQMQRELEYHPEQHIDLQQHPAAQSWVEQKRGAVSNARGELSGQERHRIIVTANAALQEFVDDDRTRLVRQTAEMERALWIKRQLHVREYAFGLFSQNFLGPLLLDQTIN